LNEGLGSRGGYASAPPEDLRWLAKRGHAASPLRPAGIATIEGKRVDVISEGELIEPGQPIEVVRVDGNRIVVRRISTDHKE
jgi:membrane-bound serine protease (ClpP class)